MTFSFGTLCSGIEAASEAFVPLGAECRYVSEIEPFPCAVLADRHGAGKPMRMPRPEEVDVEGATTKAEREQRLKERRARQAAIRAVDGFARWGNRIPNYGDLTQIDPDELPEVDLLVAGFPCQDFSIAGLRQSLSGSRGNLTLFGVKLIHELRKRRRIRGVLLEQVPDILNTKDNAFGALLGGIVGHDAAIVPGRRGKWTNAGVADGPLGTAVWRVLDAQYAGVAQRRERLFAVISFGDGPDPVEVLFERQGLSRHPPSRGEAGEGFARAFDEGADVGRGPGGRSPNRRAPAQGGVPFGCDYDQAVGRPLVAAAAGNRSDIETETVVVGTPTSNGKAAGSATQQDAEQGLLIPTTYASVGHFGGMVRSEVSDPLRATGGDTGGGGEALIAHSLRGEGFDASEDGTGRGTPIVPVTYSIMPQNSGKDYKARAVDVAQPLMASGPAGGDQGGDYIVQPIAFNARQDPISGAVVGPLDTDGATHAIAFSCKDHGADAGDIAPTMRAMGHTGSHPNAGGQLAVAFSLRGRENGAQAEVEEGDVSPSLRAAEGGSTRPFVAFQQSQSGVREVKLAPTLDANMGSRRMNGIVDHEMAVRRITVVEAERLQGFRDGYTLIEWPTANRKDEELEEFTAYLISHGYSPEEAEILAQTPDGPRYRGISNSKAVPLVRKLGERYAAALRRFIDQGSA